MRKQEKITRNNTRESERKIAENGRNQKREKTGEKNDETRWVFVAKNIKKKKSRRKQKDRNKTRKNYQKGPKKQRKYRKKS